MRKKNVSNYEGQIKREEKIWGERDRRAKNEAEIDIKQNENRTLSNF